MGQTIEWCAPVHLACCNRGSTLAHMDRDPYRLDYSPLLLLYAVGGVLAAGFWLAFRRDPEASMAAAFYVIVGALLVVGVLGRRQRRR